MAAIRGTLPQRREINLAEQGYINAPEFPGGLDSLHTTCPLSCKSYAEKVCLFISGPLIELATMTGARHCQYDPLRKLPMMA
jgi:hypothetical protein